MNTRRLSPAQIAQQERVELGANADLLAWYRRVSDEQPSAALDARILAMAQAAVAAPSARPAARRRLPLWMSVAASTAVVVLGAGLAWRMQLESPRPAQQAMETARQDAARGDAGGGSATSPAPPLRDAPAPKPTPGVTASSTMSAEPPPDINSESRELGAARAEQSAAVAMAPSAETRTVRDRPEASMSEQAGAVTEAGPVRIEEDAASPPDMARRAAPPPSVTAAVPPLVATPPPPAPAAAVAAPGEGAVDLRDRLATSPPPPPAEAAAPSSGAAHDDAFAGTPEMASKQAPASSSEAARSPLDRQVWVQNILALLSSGHREEARISLAEWRRRFPRADVPEPLRSLLDPADPAWVAESPVPR